MDQNNVGSGNPSNPRTPATPLTQPSTPSTHFGPLTPNVTTPYADYPYLSQGTPAPQLDMLQVSPAPGTPLSGGANLPQRSPMSSLLYDSSRQASAMSASNPLLTQLVERNGESWGNKSSNSIEQQLSDEIEYTLDFSNVDVLALLKCGEELLSDIMTRIQDTLNSGRGLVLPLEKEQIQMFHKRIIPMLETVEKTLPGFFKRLRMIQDAICQQLDKDIALQTDKFIPLTDSPVGTLPIAFEDELKNASRPDMWREYLELKETLLKRDAYLKTIIDAERAMLQQMNCVLFP